MLQSWLKRDESPAAATTSVGNNSPVISSHLNIDEPSPSTSTSKPLNVSKVYGDTDVFYHSHRNVRHYITCAICLAVSKANNDLASKIGSCIHVYNDAKKLTLSGYSFPGRVVVSKYASNFQMNSK